MQPEACGCFATPRLKLGGANTPFSAAHPNNRETFPIEKRAAKVPKQNLAAARDLDQKFHNSQRGEVGPIEAKLLEFEARNGPKPHAVVGFILGTFGELSNSCYSLCTAIARVGDAKKKSGRPSRKSPNAGNQTTEKNPVPDPAPAPALTKRKRLSAKRMSYTSGDGL